MNGKHQELGTPISLDEMLRPSPPEMDLNQPVEAAPEPINIDPARSTTDPFQINFATVDIVDKLHNSRTGSGLKIFALVFVGGPTMILGLGLIVMAWSDPQADAIHVLFATLLGLAAAGFWPYVIFAGRRRRSPSS
jgi:hypothetical protein